MWGSQDEDIMLVVSPTRQLASCLFIRPRRTRQTGNGIERAPKCSRLCWPCSPWLGPWWKHGNTQPSRSIVSTHVMNPQASSRLLPTSKPTIGLRAFVMTLSGSSLPISALNRGVPERRSKMVWIICSGCAITFLSPFRHTVASSRISQQRR